VRAVVFVSHRDFDRLWTLALSGLLKHGHIVITSPPSRNAFVLSVSFSTHREE
jgi:hypothetical protein